jgi:hypothetical protein
MWVHSPHAGLYISHCSSLTLSATVLYKSIQPFLVFFKFILLKWDLLKMLGVCWMLPLLEAELVSHTLPQAIATKLTNYLSPRRLSSCNFSSKSRPQSNNLRASRFCGRSWCFNQLCCKWHKVARDMGRGHCKREACHFKKAYIP